jgi:hypothetical protein
VLERFRLQAGESGNNRPEREEELGYVVGLPELAPGEIIVPAEGDHATFTYVAMELEGPEGELTHAHEERLLFCQADQRGSVAEALGKIRRGVLCVSRAIEDVKLCHNHLVAKD